MRNGPCGEEYSVVLANAYCKAATPGKLIPLMDDEGGFPHPSDPVYVGSCH